MKSIFFHIVHTKDLIFNTNPYLYVFEFRLDN